MLIFLSSLFSSLTSDLLLRRTLKADKSFYKPSVNYLLGSMCGYKIAGLRTFNSEGAKMCPRGAGRGHSAVEESKWCSLVPEEPARIKGIMSLQQKYYSFPFFQIP